jgi:hypothetical protein
MKRLLALVATLTTLPLVLTPGNGSAAPKVTYEIGTADLSPSQELFPYTAATAARKTQEHAGYLIVGGNGWSAAAAQQAAQYNCLQGIKNPTGNDCRTGSWVYNGYVAISWHGNSWGSGWGNTKKRAEQEAKQTCTNFAGTKCLGHTYSQVSRAYDPGKEATGGSW